MGMQVGVFPAVKGDDGEWRFLVMETDFKGGGRIIFGTEPDEDGMKEPKFREFLVNEYGLTAAQINQAVRDSIEKAAGQG
jgi:hypothetical protein